MLKLLALVFGGLKLGKVLTSGGTMLVSVVAYSFVFGWPYAAGFVLLMFVHEMGHYVAARQRGLAVGLPTFIPFLGAWIQLKDIPHNAEVEAYVGLGGPLVGTLGAFACYYAARQFDSSLLLAISYSGFFLNLFNMVPVSPFDGGRITAVLGPRVWLLGAPILVGMFLWHPSPFYILFVLLAAPQLMKAIRYDKNAPENRAYYEVGTEQRVTYTAFYLILLVVLASMTFSVHEMLGAAGRMT